MWNNVSVHVDMTAHFFTCSIFLSSVATSATKTRPVWVCMSIRLHISLVLLCFLLQKFHDVEFVLSTHAYWQGVDTSVTVLFVCLFVRLRIYPARIKLAASNFARWFMGVVGRESPILGNFAPPEAQDLTNRPATEK